MVRTCCHLTSNQQPQMHASHVAAVGRTNSPQVHLICLCCVRIVLLHVVVCLLLMALCCAELMTLLNGTAEHVFGADL